MQTSEQIGEFAAALAKAQADMEGAMKGSVNPHFKSRYSDLASVRDACVPALAANNIAVIQSPEVSGDVVSVETMLIHASGQWIKGTISCLAQNGAAQPVGSAITYLRRYSLLAFAGIAPEDDDAEAAHGRNILPPKQDIQTRPEGFDAWLQTLIAAADEGTAKLQAVWQASKMDYRGHLTRTDSGRWDALKAAAALMTAKAAKPAKVGA